MQSNNLNEIPIGLNEVKFDNPFPVGWANLLWTLYSVFVVKI